MTKKNKIKYILTITLMLLLSILIPNKMYTYASESEYTALTIKADVSDYDGDIAFTFTQDSGFNYNVLLTKSKGYTQTINIVGNVNYTAKAIIKENADKYKIENLDEKYKVTGKNVEINFKVCKSDLQVTENPNINTSSTENGEISDNETAYKKYIEAVSFIDNNSKYINFLKLYNNDIMKSYFLNANSLNTEEDWKKMSDFEKWNYYILYVRTKTLLLGENAVTSEEEFIKQLNSEISLLNNIEDGDKVIEAVKTIWRWEWKYWQKTGEMPNLYDEYTEGSAKKYTETELTDKDDDNNEESKESENSLSNGLKRNLFSLILLAVVGIAVVVVIVIRRKKNYDTIEKE